MIGLEFRSVIRSNKLLFLILLFCFSAITSVMFGYYAKDIVASFSDIDINALSGLDPDVEHLFISYMKNVIQVVNLLIAYYVASSVNLSKDNGQKLVYYSHINKLSALIYPKLLALTTAILIASLIGGVVAGYMIWAVQGDFSIAIFSQAMFVQMIGLLFASAMSAVIAIYSHSTIIAVIGTYFLTLLADFLKQVDWLETYSPFLLFRPDELVTQDKVMGDYTYNILTAVVVIIILMLLINLKKVRYTNK